MGRLSIERGIKRKLTAMLLTVSITAGASGGTNSLPFCFSVLEGAAPPLEGTAPYNSPRLDDRSRVFRLSDFEWVNASRMQRAAGAENWLREQLEARPGKSPIGNAKSNGLFADVRFNGVLDNSTFGTEIVRWGVADTATGVTAGIAARDRHLELERLIREAERGNRASLQQLLAEADRLASYGITPELTARWAATYRWAYDNGRGRPATRGAEGVSSTTDGFDTSLARHQYMGSLTSILLIRQRLGAATPSYRRPG